MSNNKTERLLREHLSIHNNFELLKKFGGNKDVVITYRAAPSGRSGLSSASKTEVWSPNKVEKLNPPFQPFDCYTRKFVGKKKISFPLAVKWAEETFGYQFINSPFGGLMPLRINKVISIVLKEKGL